MPRTARIAAVFALFLVAAFSTKPAYLGDTNRYIGNILDHRAHVFEASQDPFWDFGHPAWRPLVNFIFDVAGPTVRSFRGHGDDVQTIAWLMFAISLCATLAATLLMWSFLERHVGAVPAWIGTAAFLCTNGILDYSRSGSSYVSGLAFLVLALWLMQSMHIRQRAGSEAWVQSAAAGLSLGAALLFWVPFLFAIPAAILYGLYGSPAPSLRPRLKAVVIVLLFSGIALASVYAAILHQRQIHSFAGLTSWMNSSRNNELQTDRLKRSVSGIPRSFLDLGDDTLMLKRYAFHDPYAPVHLSQILLAPVTGKLMLFYLYMGGLALVLWRDPGGRRILLLLAAAAAGVLFFAIALFEPSSTEKYMPAYPFVFLAAAYAIRATASRRTIQSLMVIFLLGVLCAGNLYSKNTWRGQAAYRAFLERKNNLDSQAKPDSMVALVDIFDPFYRLPALLLLDDDAQVKSLWLYDVVEVASTRAFTWRQDFASNAIRRWSAGKQVWITSRFLADKPLPQWRWVEGDTGRVSWTELPEFFGRLEVEGRVGGDDGFLLLANNQHNVDLLKKIAEGSVR